MTLGEYLAENALSQNKFARLSGIPQTVVSRVVRFELSRDCALGGFHSATIKRIEVATGGDVTFIDIMGGVVVGADE